MIISVYNRKGGVGKSTVAVNLAHNLSRLAKPKKGPWLAGPTLLVDSDSQCDATRVMMGDDGSLDTDDRPTLMDLYQGNGVLYSPDDPTQSIVRTAAYQPRYENLNGNEKIGPYYGYISSVRSLSNLELQLNSPWNLHSRLTAKEHGDVFGFYRYVIVDMPGHMGQLVANGIVAADLLLIPVDILDRSGVVNLKEVIQAVQMAIQLSNKTEITTKIIINRVAKRLLREPQLEEIQIIARKNGIQILETMVPQNAALQNAWFANMPIAEFDHRSDGGRAFRSLAQEIAQWGLDHAQRA